MTIKRLSVALLALTFAATASVSQARSHRPHAAVWSARSYQGYEAPWTFACIKDHGTSRCNDLN